MEPNGSRLDRELKELLEELRVVLPGVQVIFAFLLTAPFSSRFGDLARVGKAVYLVALAGAATASILFMTPTSLHRLRFRERDKEWLLQTANRLALTGLAVAGATISCGLYLVTAFVYRPSVGITVAGCAAALVLTLWYAVPLLRRARS